ncbi:hypothetical protein [Phytohabitans rumicis]|uniref:hypothetical protein n=1 Tax=Phytohabitans rumicis TaxID=1076125 RepID=UPI001FE9B53B|nr:hypothetical protein [Phytohabitans rumicis]
MPRLNITATRCEALFVSELQHSQRPNAEQVRAAVVRTVRTHGVQNCVAQVAQEFGDHPDTAVARMRWARETVAAAYTNRVRGWSTRTTICPKAAAALPPAKAA